MTPNTIAGVADILDNPAQVVQWVEEQEPGSQKIHADEILNFLIEQATQPKSALGNTFKRLCGFVDQSCKAQSEEVRTWAYSGDVLLRLFDFYIEWSESDRPRLMKLVLDLITQLIRQNPKDETFQSASRSMLDNLVSIVAGHSTKPVVKSAVKTLDYFLAKKLFSLDELKFCYISYRHENGQLDDLETWELFFTDLFRWMRVANHLQTTGRLIVCVYRLLRQRDQDEPNGLSMDIWHQWLLSFLADEPSLLEGMKNYIFLPTFKADRAESLRFLQKMNDDEPSTRSNTVDMDFPALLQLAALETGKKVGLVEEPDLGGQKRKEEQNSPIVLNERIFQGVLAHPSPDVRSLALSLLITSPSTTKPFSSTTLDLLRKHLPSVFADSDAKFRVDVSGKVRDIFKRVRGAIFVLKRSIPRARAKAQKNHHPQADDATASQPVVYHANLVKLPEPQLVHCLDYHEKFLRWYVRFLRDELTPVASYQRHVASVKALTTILRIVADSPTTLETADDQELFYDLFDVKWLRALFDLVMDPFEDVRELSAGALKGLFSDRKYRRFAMTGQGDENSPAVDITGFLQRADARARQTARADHSDGVARACQLVYRFSPEGGGRLSFLSKLISELERKIDAAETDLGRAVLEAPLHSDFASLCFTWQVVSEVQFSESELAAVQILQDTLVTCCERVWSAVRDILCDDSPEGHLPQELEEIDGLDTKDVLSYSFRAIHESSNLMRTMALTVKNRSRSGSISPSTKGFERIGNLTFDQLSSLRHRGAFTTVSLTFATCCQQTKHLEHEDNDSLLDVWYRGAMDAIFAQASTTRRSAGIPSLMTGILSANASKPSFEQVMERLLEIARIEARVAGTDRTNLPQVHAYNCLKDIFKSSLLTSMGNKSDQYLPDCLELAASALRSEVWAIRNCGLIFLRSLIDCLFGSQENKAMIEAGWDGKANRIPYHRYPTLPKVLVSLLKAGHQMITDTPSTSSAAESVFPALDIIRRAGPPDILRDELEVHITRYLASPVWHVREIAARTLCSCLLHKNWLVTIRKIFTDALSDSTRNIQNHVHGVLLTLRFVFERLSEVALDSLLGDLSDLNQFLNECNINKRFCNCPDIVAAYLEIVNMIWAFQRSRSLALEAFDLSPRAEKGTALLKKQRIINDVSAASKNTEQVEKLRVLFLNSHVGVNSMVAALETMPPLWHTSSTADSALAGLVSLYVDVCLQTGLVEAQVVAVTNLAEVLDQLLLDGKLDKVPSSSLRELWVGLPLRPMNPALSNAVIRASGCIMAVLRHSQEVTTVGLRTWGLMMADAGLDDESFDTRLAAAESLRSFFSVEARCTSEEYLPALIALYDALNDDDDDVRVVGSAAATGILGQALVPLEAASSLLEWITLHFAGSQSLRPIIARRIAWVDESWEPASDQLAGAMRLDDSLFAVEEKNLFIDEVREAKRWISVLEALEWAAGDETLAQLDAWVSGGLAQVLLLMDQEDGPLGWASNPRVFAICSRVVLCSVALGRGRGSEGVRESVAKIKVKLASHECHVSGLLMAPFEDDPE